MIRENKFRHIRIRKVVILIDTNSIFPQLFVFPSKGGFRQPITQNVRILDNLNFFQPLLGVHREAFKDHTKTTIQTSLSRYVWDLKNQGSQPNITWKLIDRGKPFSPVTGVCQLCTKEKFYIMYKQEMAELNSRNEIFNHCRHMKSALLFKPIRKKSPGS